MKKSWLHKIIAIVFISVVLFPMMVQIAHVLEEHEHNTYVSRHEKNFHKDEVDCVICKFHLTSHIFYFINDVLFQDISIILEQPYNIYTLKYNSFTHFKPSRAPPGLV